jgi:hypothetical protein
MPMGGHIWFRHPGEDVSRCLTCGAVRNADAPACVQPPTGTDAYRALLSGLTGLGESAFEPREWSFLDGLTSWRGSFTARQRQWLDELAAKHAERASW